VVVKARSMMSGGQDLQLPPGFRFHPTDEELVVHYLCRRCTGAPIAVPIIAEIDLYKFDPWQLPSTSSSVLAFFFETPGRILRSSDPSPPTCAFRECLRP
jgi:hypothetical protein